MRVISGSAKGHKLIAPNSPRVRPALDKVRGAIFNILFDVSGSRVLDLFAGSGAVGIEALSRGAKEAVFVEEWSRAIESIERNLAHCKLSNHAHIISGDVLKTVSHLSKKNKHFDLIFVDPPYLKSLVNTTLKQLAVSTLITTDTLIVVEHHPKEPIEVPCGLTLTDNRKYGQTRVSFLKKLPAALL